MTEYDKWGEEPPLITPEMLEAWIISNEDDLLVMNKPGWVGMSSFKKKVRGLALSEPVENIWG